jgi:hypothetical protein
MIDDVKRLSRHELRNSMIAMMGDHGASSRQLRSRTTWRTHASPRRRRRSIAEIANPALAGRAAGTERQE